MGSNKAEIIAFLIMTIFVFIQGILVFIKPEWTIGRREWYRVRKDMEKEYQKRFFWTQCIGAGVFLCGTILCCFEVHWIVTVLLAVLGGLIECIIYPKQGKYFYDNVSK